MSEIDCFETYVDSIYNELSRYAASDDKDAKFSKNEAIEAIRIITVLRTENTMLRKLAAPVCGELLSEEKGR